MSRLHTSLAVVAIAVAIATGVTLIARSGSDGANGGEGGVTADAVCRAATAAADEGAEPARRIFFDDAHERLHRLAARLSDRGADERAAAARLLEAKQRVEAAMTDDTPIAEPLRALASATERAAALDDGSAPDPCEVSR